MKALKKKTDFIEFFGIGGYLMEKEGIRSFFPLSDLSIMGIFENWRQTLKAWKRLKETKNLIVGINPDLVVTMDFPGFNFRLGKGLRKRLKETPLIHYVAPTVWAWRPGRAKKVSKFLTHLLTLFPFEPSGLPSWPGASVLSPLPHAVPSSLNNSPTRLDNFSPLRPARRRSRWRSP